MAQVRTRGMPCATPARQTCVWLAQLSRSRGCSRGVTFGRHRLREGVYTGKRAGPAPPSRWGRSAPSHCAKGAFERDPARDWRPCRMPTYPSTGTGALAARRQVGSGWSIKTSILAAEDVNLDGCAELLARDTAGYLWLYPGACNGGFKPRVRIGSGWQQFTGLTMRGPMLGGLTIVNPLSTRMQRPSDRPRSVRPWCSRARRVR